MEYPRMLFERRFVPRLSDLSRSPVAALVETDRVDPLTGGVSIGPSRAALVGTLGLIVIDEGTSDKMMLSNFHVLAVDNDFSQGDEVVQPALGDGGASPGDVVGTLERAVLGGRVDGAVARITDRGNACSIEDVGAVAGSAQAMIDLRVRKRGRTTV
jgi:hypothetical protein